MLLPPSNFSRIKDREVDLLQNLIPHLIKANVFYFPINSPPALSSEAQGTRDVTGQCCSLTLASSIHLSYLFFFHLTLFFCGFHSDSSRIIFSEEKQRIKREHRQECHSAFRSIFGKGPCMEGDLVVINFFALVLLLNIFYCTMIVSALALWMTIDLHHVVWVSAIKNWSLNDGYDLVIRKTNNGYSDCTFRKDGALQSFSNSVAWWLLLLLFRIGNFVAWKYDCDILEVEDNQFSSFFFYYSPPSGFERQFRKELPDLYKYLKEAPIGKVFHMIAIQTCHWFYFLMSFSKLYRFAG